MWNARSPLRSAAADREFQSFSPRNIIHLGNGFVLNPVQRIKMLGREHDDIRRGNSLASNPVRRSKIRRKDASMPTTESRTHTIPCTWGTASLEPRPERRIPSKLCLPLQPPEQRYHQPSRTQQRQWSIRCGCALFTFSVYLFLSSSSFRC